MIIRFKGTSSPVDESQPMIGLFGFHRTPPGSLILGPDGQQVEIIYPALPGVGGDRYLIQVDGKPMTIPADWVVSWASGLAARGGTNLAALLDKDVHQRHRCMQALMICHQQGLLEYLGVEEEGSPHDYVA